MSRSITQGCARSRGYHPAPGILHTQQGNFSTQMARAYFSSKAPPESPSYVRGMIPQKLKLY